MGENTFQLTENGTVVATAKVTIYDFIPIVKIDEGGKGENVLWATESCSLSEKDKLNLTDHFDKDLREYIIPEIVIAKNSMSKIPIKILQGYDPWGPQDSDGMVEFSCSNSSVTITIDGQTGSKKDEKKVDYGNEIVLQISHKLGRGQKFSVDIKGKDDDDDSFGVSKTVVTSGKLNFTVIEKHVFMEDEVKRAIDEILFLAPFADAGTAPEYDENYCMQAAERSLAELFQNNTNFYSVDRSHVHRSNIGFSGKNAIDRGTKFKALGYVKTTFKYNGYKIDHTKRKAIVDSSSYKKVRYDLLSLKDTKLQDFFEKQVSEYIGHHVFYFTVTSGFHTLMLIIDNTNPCDSTYTVYDQHGETSSKGAFKEISEGIRKQTCWTFANTCLNRYKSHLKYNNKKHLQWDSTETTLWKMQRK